MPDVSRAEAEAVLSCWHDIEDRKFSKKGGGKPKQMTLCSAQRTNSSIPDPEYFVEDHPMPENILAGVPEHVPGGLIGTHEGILRYNRELYKKDHKEVRICDNRTAHTELIVPLGHECCYYCPPPHPTPPGGTEAKALLRHGVLIFLLYIESQHAGVHTIQCAFSAGDDTSCIVSGQV